MVSTTCIACGTVKHPLRTCHKFQSLPHKQMVSLLKSNNLCLNSLKPGHFVKACSSSQRCQRCQEPHHTLLHIETNPNSCEQNAVITSTTSPAPQPTTLLSHIVQADSKSPQSLLMTCRIMVTHLIACAPKQKVCWILHPPHRLSRNT